MRWSPVALREEGRELRFFGPQGLVAVRFDPGAGNLEGLRE